jgi:N-acetylmuramic acid 6-phosphate etherase
MTTENVSPRFVDLDAWSTLDALHAMHEGQLAAAAAVRPALPALARAAEEAAARLGHAGRLIYAGAGTSGRIGVQDGAELPPTFDWPAERVVFLLAGGMAAMTVGIEGAEDDAADAARRMAEYGVGTADVAIGIAASGTTPFAIAALRAARAAGALTIGIANNAGAPLFAEADHPILAETGEEVLAGSTRMKAGTAQKIIVNLLSTAIMLRLGRVFRGLMVQMRPTNAKLRRRAVAMVARLAACAPDWAEQALAAAGGDIRAAVLVAGGVTPEQARERLTRHGGSLRAAIEKG